MNLSNSIKNKQFFFEVIKLHVLSINFFSSLNSLKNGLSLLHENINIKIKQHNRKYGCPNASHFD